MDLTTVRVVARPTPSAPLPGVWRLPFRLPGVVTFRRCDDYFPGTVIDMTDFFGSLL